MKYVEYDKNNPPTGACFNKTIIYLGLIIYARRASDGSYHLDSNGEYVIDPH